MALDFGKIKGKLNDYEKQEKENEKRITNDFVAFIDANNTQIERFIQEKFEEQAEEGFASFTITLFAKDNTIIIKFNHDNECIITKTFDYVKEIKRNYLAKCLDEFAVYLGSLRLRVSSNYGVQSGRIQQDFDYYAFIDVTPK